MRERWKKKLTKCGQMSDSFILGAFLAFSGGFQDAYTYIVRDEVFANAQTGNIVLMSTYFLKGEWLVGLRYLLPLVAFAAGVLAAALIGRISKRTRLLHWRQIVLLVEMLIMLGVGFMPQELNLPANILISFSCAMQVQAFREVCGNKYASTMCIGNLRSGTSSLFDYLSTGDRRALSRSLCYFGVILIFALGAGLGGVLSGICRERTIWISCGLLIVAFLLMELDRE